MSVSFLSGVSINNGVKLVQPPALITISSQPTNNTVNYGSNATFGVTAAITRGAVLTYQWQYNQLGQGSWTNITGANSSTYTVNSVISSANTDAYRVVLTGTLSANSVTSNTARLYVTPAVITINTQPSSNSVNEGQTSTFSVSASVTLNATLSYQWQRNDGSYWTNVSGATSNTYTTGSLTNAADNNDVYRVYVSADKGATGVYSSNATLTVTSSVIPNSIDVASYNGAYGAGDGTQSYINSGTSFGTVTSNLISSFAFINGSDVGPKTVIELKDAMGVYPGYDVLNGAIGMDSGGSRRTFTIAGTNAVFQYDGFDAYFKNGSDSFGLQSAVGTNVTVLYDPNQQSTYSSGYFEPDTITYNSTTYYGANRDISDSVLPVFGFLNLDSDYVLRIIYDGTNTKVKFNPGSFTYGSPQKSLTVASNGAIGSDTNGSTKYLKVNGTNQTLTFNSSTGYYTASGDVFSLYSNLGQSISAIYDSADQPAQGGGGGGGGGASGTYTAGTDYADGNGGPSGVSFAPVGGPYSYPQLFLNSSYWSNSTGFNAVKALTSGSTFTVSAYPASGGSPVTSTITLLSNFTNPYGTQWRADMSSSPTVSTGSWPNYVPLSITLGSGGGGGGGGGSGSTSVTLSSGFWFDTGGISLRVLQTDTTNIALMDAIPSGATLYLTDINNNTASVTLSGSLSKVGPFGPPGNERYFWDGTVTTNNADFPSKFGYITSLTY